MNSFYDRFSTIRTKLGKTILAQLLNSDWENPTLKVLEGQGVAFGTHTGSRRSRNEDRVTFANVETICAERFIVAIICDGVGGSQMGDQAANLVIASFLENLANLRTKNNNMFELTSSLVRKADEVVRRELEGRGTTTLSVLLASSNGQTVAANIGDSRIFSWKPEDEFLQLSVDDTIENELKQFAINDSTALDFHRLRGSLSQAIGELGRTSNELRINLLDLTRREGVIIATDGAWKSDAVGFNLIALNSTTAGDAARRILSLSAWTGGVDNVSVIAIEKIGDLFNSKNIKNHSENGAEIAAYICDSKIVIFNSDLDPVISSKTEKNFVNKTLLDYPRKSSSRRKPKEPSAVTQATQLDLTEELEKNEPPIIERPKLEISTDKDSKRKQ